jgi:hypothetical protein
MNGRQTFTDVDARVMIDSIAWQHLVIHLMQRLWGQSQAMIGAQGEMRAVTAGSMAELRELIAYPYKVAQRESPLETMQSMDWLREWLGFGPQIDREAWAKFHAWQAEQHPPTVPKPDDRNPWDSTHLKPPSGLV